MKTSKERQSHPLLKYPSEFRDSIINNIKDSVSIIDVRNFKIVSVNRAFLDELGLDENEVIGKSCYKVIHRKNSPCATTDHPCPLLTTLKTGQHAIFEHIHCHKNGKMINMEVSATPIKDEKGEISYVVHVARNITEHKRIEEELIKLKKAVETSGEAIFLTDREGIITYVNPEFTRLYGYSAEEVIGKTTPRILKSGTMQPRDYENFWKTILNKQIVRGEFVNKAKDGRVLNIDGSANPVFDNNGNIIGFLAIQRDISDRKKAEQHLDYLAYHDALTGLPNRSLFYDRLRQAVAQANRYKRIVAVMLLDLDKFKEINDTLGHNIGDLLLQAIAKRLTSYLRKVDTVSRFGGDEFAFIITEIIHVQGAERVTSKILASFFQPFTIDGHEISIGASLGVSLYPDHGDNVDELVKKADSAMYHAKDQGRNNFQFFKTK